MSYLRLYQPVVDEAEPVDDEPCILPIRDYLHLRRPRRWTPETTEAVEDDDESADRARVLYANRRCPYCKHPVVEPLELADGVRNRHRSTIPGTATLVGFHCDSCYREWPA